MPKVNTGRVVTARRCATARGTVDGKTLKTILVMAGTLCIALLALLCALRFPGLRTESGDVSWKVREREIVGRLLASPVLLYHNIDGAGVFSVTLETLRAHFGLFRDRGVEVISLDDYFGRLENPAPFSRPVMMLTFDDSYRAMFTKLLPAVREFGYPATLFVYTGGITESDPGSLTWGNLRELDRGGVRIECHSMSHPDLVRIDNKNTEDSRRALFEEMYLSRRVLELYLGRPVKYFAFPFGSYSLSVIELCRFAGYERVFTTDQGPNIVTRNNYCLRRQHVLRTYPIGRIEGFIR